MDLRNAGTVSVGPLIQMVAVNDYGHWNFKPAAKMMWDYFMQFSRDPQTKELIYHGRK